MTWILGIYLLGLLVAGAMVLVNYTIANGSIKMGLRYAGKDWKTHIITILFSWVSVVILLTILLSYLYYGNDINNKEQ